MGRKDINWINAVKAICIILVFLRHCENYYGAHLGWLDPLYLTIYVNAFFFVSGYLLFWKQLSEPKILEDRKLYKSTGGGKILLLNVLYRIIIPTVLFSIIEFVPSCLIQGREITVGYALQKTIGGGTYWFTSALAVAELVLLTLFCTRKRNIWFYTAVCLALGAAGYVSARYNFPGDGIWAWRQGLLALVFLALGGVYKFSIEDLDVKVGGRWKRGWRMAAVVLIVAVYVAMVLGLKGHNNPLISTLGIQPLGFVTSAIGCLLLVWLCKRLPEWKPLTFIGQNSLGFYFLSGALPITLSKVAHLALPGTHGWLLPILWLACLALAYVAVLVINRWLPWVWDLRRK